MSVIFSQPAPWLKWTCRQGSRSRRSRRAFFGQTVKARWWQCASWLLAELGVEYRLPSC